MCFVSSAPRSLATRLFRAFPSLRDLTLHRFSCRRRSLFPTLYCSCIGPFPGLVSRARSCAPLPPFPLPPIPSPRFLGWPVSVLGIALRAARPAVISQSLSLHIPVRVECRLCPSARIHTAAGRQQEQRARHLPSRVPPSPPQPRTPHYYYLYSCITLTITTTTTTTTAAAAAAAIPNLKNNREIADAIIPTWSQLCPRSRRNWLGLCRPLLFVNFWF